MPSASLRSTCKIPGLCAQFVLILYSASQLHPLFFPLFEIQTVLLQVLPLFSSQSFLLVHSVLPLQYVRWSLSFVAFIFFSNAVIANSLIYVGHSPVPYMLCHYSETVFCRHFEYIPGYIIVSCSPFTPHPLASIFHFSSQNIRAFSSPSTSTSVSTSRFSGRLGQP